MTSVDISVRRPDGFTIDPATTGRFFVRTIARLIDIGVGFGAGCFAIFGSFLFGIAFATVGAICAEASSEAIAGTSVRKLMLGFRVVSLSGSDVIPCSPKAALKRSIAFLEPADG